MVNTIICPQCKEEIELSEALTHQIQEQISSSLASKHQKELEEVKLKSLEFAKKEIDEKSKLEMEDLKKQVEEKDKKVTEFIGRELKFREELRKFEEKDKERELEVERKLDEEKKKLAIEQEKIRLDIQKKAEEENHLKLAQKDKQLQDTLKELEDAKRKLQQGSQQTQGEAFELEFEDLLKKQYPNDKIMPVGKGVKGGDIIQEVWDKRGNYAGKILWELKNTKAWSEGWIDKLKSDKRSINAEEAVLISEIIPSDMKTAGFRESVWVTQKDFCIPLADTLRAKLIQLHYVKNSVQGKDEKMEMLYQYFSGTEFKHRVEGIIDAFSNMQQEIEKEKRYFSNKWARDEKNIRQVIDNTYGMHGDLKGIVGKVLPQIKGLELLEIEGGE